MIKYNESSESSNEFENNTKLSRNIIPRWIVVVVILVSYIGIKYYSFKIKKKTIDTLKIKEKANLWTFGTDYVGLIRSDSKTFYIHRFTPMFNLHKSHEQINKLSYWSISTDGNEINKHEYDYDSIYGNIIGFKTFRDSINIHNIFGFIFFLIHELNL